VGFPPANAAIQHPSSSFNGVPYISGRMIPADREQRTTGRAGASVSRLVLQLRVEDGILLLLTRTLALAYVLMKAGPEWAPRAIRTRSERTRRESTWTDGYSLHDPEATQPLFKQVNNARLPWLSRRHHVFRSLVSEDTPWCRKNSLQAAGISSSNWS